MQIQFAFPQLSLNTQIIGVRAEYSFLVNGFSALLLVSKSIGSLRCNDTYITFQIMLYTISMLI